MIVQTFTDRRGTVVKRTARRVYVRLWLTLPGPLVDDDGRDYPPARVIVAYAPGDVVEVRALPTDGS